MMHVTYDGRRLYVTNSAISSIDYSPRYALRLIRIGPDTFAPGLYDKGVIYEVLRPDLTIEFARANGRAASLEMRDDSDKLEGKATRTP